MHTLAAALAVGIGSLLISGEINCTCAQGQSSIIQTASLSDKEALIHHLHFQVTETIEHSENVPGLKSEEFASLKSGIAQLWNELVEKGVVEITGTDKDVRPYFVALQAIIEHVLAAELNQSVKSLTGVIHTPMPATPLCTEGGVSPELVDSTIEIDPLRLFTVKARTTIIRDYLFQGGDLYIVYPKEGIAQRTESQQQIYRKELRNYPSHLFDRPLECVSMDNDLIGAFYLFSNANGKTFAFAIKISQANSPQDSGSFGLWFGEAYNSPAQERITKVTKALFKHSLQPIALPMLFE